jgi:hypothetical protein
MKNGKDPLAETRELLRMPAAQTAENAKLTTENARQLQQMAKEHDREMKEIRALFKQLIRRIGGLRVKSERNGVITHGI